MLFSLFCLFVCLLFGFMVGSGRFGYAVPLFFAILFSSINLSWGQCPDGCEGNFYFTGPSILNPGGSGCIPSSAIGSTFINDNHHYCVKEHAECSCSGLCYRVACRYSPQSSSSSSQVQSSSSGGAPPPPQNDTTWHCQNAGGAEEGGFGVPPFAKIFKCVNGSCENTRDLHGSCQDWGFCEDAVSDCQIADSLGHPPCGRSGDRFTTSSRCVYACGDGRDLSCKPVSTGYVAGNIYAGECPDVVPSDCRPSSSASSSASSSPSSSPSSSTSYSSPKADTVEFADNTGKDYEIDYSPILTAILDTLHHANVQRDFQLELDNASKLDLDNINTYSQFSYTELSKQTNTLNSIANNGLPYPTDVKNEISESKDLLDNINNFLRSDSLLSRPPDTSYNPLLRDIKKAIDSIDVAVTVSPSDSGGSVFTRDTAFAKWWSKYYADSVQSNSVVGKALKDFVPSRDSVRSADCNGFVGCMSVYSDMGYCSGAWGVNMSDCVSGGTPIDNVVNVEVSILDKITKAFWGPDTVDFTVTDDGDTNVVYPPQKDTAESWISSAFRSLFSPESTSALLRKVDSMKVAAENAKNDSTKIQPDSLWLDSAAAANYARHMLLPSGTGTNCFICHADLGNFGGLTSNNLSIHVDFSNFGGFNFCDIIRAAIKIMTFVVCMSLTLGSWAAAFGYNPKNDA